MEEAGSALLEGRLSRDYCIFGGPSSAGSTWEEKTLRCASHRVAGYSVSRFA